MVFMRKVVSFFIGIVLFSLLPIIGWDVCDIDGFLDNPYRLMFVVMMATLSFLVVIFVPKEGRGYGEGESNKLIKRQKLTILALQIIPLLIVIFSPYFDRNHFLTFNENSIIRFMGLLFTFIGFSLMNWSIIVLGRQFSVNVTIQKDHKLITNGPYKYIRHPRYLGIIVFLTGIPLVFISIIPLFLNLLLFIVLIWRIRDEEKLMHQSLKKNGKNIKEQPFLSFHLFIK
jgi:protein-S-isoprenylcysteine O-methyltransferase Ste14